MATSLETHFIALEGVCCVGKTGTFDALQGQFSETPGVHFITEAARGYLVENSLTVEVLYSPSVQGILQRNVLESEAVALACIPTPTVVVEDRYGISAAVYVFSEGHKKAAQQLLAKVNTHTHNRTVFLFDPTGVPYTPDRIRRESPEKRLQVHDAYIEFLDRYGIAYTVVSGTLDDKIQTVAREIQKRIS